jgi:hypothetical protein
MFINRNVAVLKCNAVLKVNEMGKQLKSDDEFISKY